MRVLLFYNVYTSIDVRLLGSKVFDATKLRSWQEWLARRSTSLIETLYDRVCLMVQTIQGACAVHAHRYHCVCLATTHFVGSLYIGI